MLMTLGPLTLTQAMLALFAAFGLGSLISRRRHEPHDTETAYRQLEERIRHPWKHYAKRFLSR
jgi:hypothetical protein